MRLDLVEGFDPRLSPMLMARRAMSPKLTLRASAGAAFRPPSFDDLFLPPRASAAGNPDLQPERSWNGDIGATVTKNRWTFGAGGFINRIHDLIQWQPGAAGVWRPHNVDGARVIGLEIETSGMIPLRGASRSLELIANYTRLDPRETGDASNTAGKVLIYRPRHRANLGATLAIDRVEFGTQWGYTGPVYTTRANTKSLPGYVVGDAVVRWRAVPAIDVEGRVLNLTDTEYQDIRDYPAPGREWRIAIVGRTGS